MNISVRAFLRLKLDHPLYVQQKINQILGIYALKALGNLRVLNRIASLIT